MLKKALVTGGAGFIGSHLVQTLLSRNVEVRVFDNFATGIRSNIALFADDIELCEADLRDADACRAACEGVDAVFHLGALGSVPRSVADPMTTHAVNATGSLNMLIAAREADVARFVLSSSSSVYGDTPVLPKHEQMRPQPRSPYAVSKLAAEEYALAFNRTYGMQTVALRYFNVFGPRQDPNSQYAAVIPRFIKALLTRQSPVIYGDGGQSRDFTYVANVVEANILGATVDDAAGAAYNIACGDQIVLIDMLNQLSRLLDSPCTPHFEPDRAGDIKHSRADIGAATAALGFAPQVSFNEGLALLVESIDRSQFDGVTQ